MITFRQLTAQDTPLFPLALELLNRTQGVGLFATEYLSHRIHDDNSYVVGGFQGSQLVAVGIAQVLNSEGFGYYLPFDHTLPDIFRTQKIGSFSTLCVREDLQGQGIGKKISTRRLQWLKEKNCSVILGVSWVSGKAHTSHRVFEKIGFRAVHKIEKFYYNSSKEKPFECPGCHAQPCTCAAILYRMDLES